MDTHPTRACYNIQPRPQGIDTAPHAGNCRGLGHHGRGVWGWACYQNRPDMLRWACAHGLTDLIDVREQTFDRTPVLEAVMKGNEDCAR